MLPVGINVFSFGGTNPYPTQKEVLNTIFKDIAYNASLYEAHEKKATAFSDDSAFTASVAIESPEALHWHLEKGADPNAKYGDGIYVFTMALALENDAIIKELLKTMIHSPRESTIKPLTEETIRLSVEQYIKEKQSLSESIFLTFNVLPGMGLVLGVASGLLLGIILSVAVALFFPTFAVAGTFIALMAFTPLIGGVAGGIMQPFLYKLKQNKKEKEIFNEKQKVLKKIDQLKEEIKKELVDKTIEKTPQKPVTKPPPPKKQLPHILSPKIRALVEKLQKPETKPATPTPSSKKPHPLILSPTIEKLAKKFQPKISPHTPIPLSKKLPFYHSTQVKQPAMPTAKTPKPKG